MLVAGVPGRQVHGADRESREGASGDRHLKGGNPQAAVPADGVSGEPSFRARTSPTVLPQPVVSVLAKNKVEVNWGKHPAADVVYAHNDPMALGAYSQLDSVDADARYHAAVLRMQVGDFPGALALADTLLARNPGHLFGYIIRGTVARMQHDTTRQRQAARDFRAHFAAESAAGRAEYRDHQPAIDEFKQAAEKP